MEPTPITDKSTNESSKATTAAENVTSSSVQDLARELHNDTASTSTTTEAPAIEATENAPSESTSNNNTESVEVHIPGLTNALHLTLPNTTANTTVEELREMVLQELRAQVNTEANSKNNNPNKDSLNKRFFIRLMFRGKELQKDDLTLAQEHIQNGSAIHGMKTFVQPEYQRRQAEQRRRLGTRRQRDSEHHEEEEQEEGGSHIGRNITSTLIPFSQQNLHETRQALATALSSFWPVNENNEREYSVVGSSANNHESTIASSTHEGSSSNSNSNMNHNPTLTDIRRVPRSRLTNDELLRLIQQERMRAALNTTNRNSYNPSRVEDSHTLHAPLPLQPSSETETTHTAENNTQLTLQEDASADTHAETSSAPNEIVNSNVDDNNRLTTQSDTGRLRVMQLTQGNRSSRRRGVHERSLAASDGSIVSITGNNSSSDNTIRNVGNALHIPRGFNSASVNVGDNAADDNFINFTGGGGGGGSGNQADDIEARLEAERNYYWKEFSVNIVIGVLFGPIGLIFPNKPIGMMAVVIGVVINLMCLMLNGYGSDRPWEIEERVQEVNE